VGIVVDGQSEYEALPMLYRQLHEASGVTILKPAMAKIQPYAPPAAIARVCLPATRVLLAKGVDDVVVLLDRENRDECCGAFASAIANSLIAATGADVSVVLKNRMFENWLLSDTSAVKAVSGRFAVSRTTERSVSPDKADHVDATALLKRCAVKNYEKVSDACAILANADLASMAQNSRSFRRFLRCAGHPGYSVQSRLP